MRIFVFIISLFTTPAFAAENVDLDSYFFFMGFELEETELADIQKVFGVAPTHQEGDAAYSYTAICYRVPGDNVTVYFESGEMGGGRSLLSYRVVEEYKTDFQCGDTDNLRIKEYRTGALEIGAGTTETIALLPGDIESRDGNDFYYYRKIPFTKDEIKKLEVKNMKYAFWDQGVSIQLFTNGEKVSGYRVTKITSW